jgi:hypothetical protein
LDGGTNLANHFWVRGQAADLQTLAQFEAVRSRPFGREGAVKGGYSDFEEE